ncbi:MAG: type IV pilin N-terminal domain-containing protein [Haloferacaceae archaeon]
MIDDRTGRRRPGRGASGERRRSRDRGRNGDRDRGRVEVPVAAALVAVVGTAVCAAALGVLPADRPTAALALRADAGADRLVLTHRGGDPLDPDRIAVRVRIDGRPLAHQPPVPFFAAEGFRSGPTGPFNSRATGPWTPGERAGLRLAGTNRPALRPGRRVTVVVRAGGVRVARATALAR